MGKRTGFVSVHCSGDVRVKGQIRNAVFADRPLSITGSYIAKGRGCVNLLLSPPSLTKPLEFNHKVITLMTLFNPTRFPEVPPLHSDINHTFSLTLKRV